MWTNLKTWARMLKRNIMALWVAAHDPRTPWYAKVVAGVVAAYALSPIDLIPDFIPVVGYLDDIILVPLGVALAIRLIPPLLLDDFRQAASLLSERLDSKLGLIGIVVVWVAAAVATAWWGWPAFQKAVVLLLG